MIGYNGFSASQTFMQAGRSAAGSSVLDLRTPNVVALQYVQAIQSALMAWPRVYDSADRASINSPMFWWQLRSDAMFAGAIKNRRQKVSGLDFWTKPADSSNGARLVADRVDWLLHKIPRFAAGRYELGQAIFRGSAFAAITGQTTRVQAPGTKKRLPWWVPGPLIDVDRWRWALQRDIERSPDVNAADRMSQPLQWHLYSYKRREWEPVRKPDHFVMWFYEQPESAMGYGVGLNQSLYAYLKAKEVALNLGLRGMRRWAMGILKAAVETMQRPGDERGNTDSEAIATQYRDALRELLAEDVLVHDKADEVDVITGGMEGHQIVTSVLEYLDRGVLSLVQAGDLTTSQGQQGVERGNAETQKGSEEEAFAWDIHLLEEALTDSLVKQVYRANRRLLELECREAGCQLGECPSIKLGQADSSRGPLEELQAIKAAQDVGMDRIPESWAYERAGIPMAGPDDRVLEAPQQGGGMDMFGGMDPMMQADEAGLDPMGEAPMPTEQDASGGPYFPGFDSVEDPMADTEPVESEPGLESELEDEPLSPDTSEGDQEASELLGKVGGITGWMEIARAVSAGELDRDTGIAGVMTFFRVDRETAELLIPEAGTAPDPAGMGGVDELA